MLGRDADPGIADAEPQLDGVVGHECGSHRNDDLALLGELDRVPDQIHQHLAQTGGIAAHAPWDLRSHLSEQLEMLFPRAHRQQARCGVDDFRDIERNRLELEMVGLDLRVVQDVVQNHE